MIGWMGKRLLAGGYRAPRYHVPSHPRLGEVEAIGRAIACAALVDQPLMIFHVSTAEGAGVIHRARGEGHKVWGETCTQYLTLTARDLDRPGLEGAMWMCSPPLREPSDQEALWWALEIGTLQTVSSDHAPYRMDESGKLARGHDAQLQGDRQRHAGPRAAPAGAVRRHGQPRAARAREVRRADRHRTGPALRPARRARAASPSAPMPTSPSGIPSGRSRSRRGRATTAPATRPSPAARSRAGRSRSCDGAR